MFSYDRAERAEKIDALCDAELGARAGFSRALTRPMPVAQGEEFLFDN